MTPPTLLRRMLEDMARANSTDYNRHVKRGHVPRPLAITVTAADLRRFQPYLSKTGVACFDDRP